MITARNLQALDGQEDEPGPPARSQRPGGRPRGRQPVPGRTSTPRANSRARLPGQHTSDSAGG